jgi:hypothetical protein
VIAVAGFVFVMLTGRGNGFFYDDWSWIELRRTGVHSILASYNQHLVMIPIAAYQFLLGTVGLAHYWLYRSLAALAHVACAVAVFAFARRRIGLLALPLAAVVVFLGSGWEYVLEPFNFGLTASLALGIAALIALDRDDRRGELIACCVLVLGLLFSELVMLFAVGIAAELSWRDRGLRRAWIWAVPLVLYGLWWLAYYDAVGAHHSVSLVPSFVASMASSAAGGVFGLNLVHGRPVLLALAAVVAWRVVRAGAMTARLAGLLIMLGSFWLIVALSRAALGQPWASRYVYTGVILIALIGAEAFRGIRTRRAPATVTVVIAAIALVGNIRAFHGGESYLHTGSATVSGELTALEIARASAPRGMVLDPRYGPQIIAGPYFAAVSAIGSSPADSLAQLLRAPEAVRAAADRVLVSAGGLGLASIIGGAGPTLANHPPVLERMVGGSARSSGACTRFRPSGLAGALDLRLAATGLLLRGITSGEPRLHVRRFAAGFDQGALPVGAGTTTLVIRPRSDPSRVPWHLRVSSAGAIEACALG